MVTRWSQQIRDTLLSTGISPHGPHALNRRLPSSQAIFGDNPVQAETGLRLLLIRRFRVQVPGGVPSNAYGNPDLAKLGQGSLPCECSAPVGGRTAKGAVSGVLPIPASVVALRGTRSRNTSHVIPMSATIPGSGRASQAGSGGNHRCALRTDSRFRWSLIVPRPVVHTERERPHVPPFTQSYCRQYFRTQYWYRC